MPYTKEEKAEYAKKYYQANKEKLAKYNKKYREKNKEERAKYAREYRKNNKEDIAKQKKEYNKNNKEEKAKYDKKYRETPNGKKSMIIKSWKNRGIKTDNYDMLYNNYLSETHCDLCRVKFGKKGDGTGTHKCCDHDHDTGLFRNFLCCSCNIKRG